MRADVLSLVLLLAAAGAAAAQTPPGPAGPPPVHDVPDVRPGRSTRVPRVWEGQPPVVPHSLRGLTPITAASNACIRCHGRMGATSGPPPAPPSHFVEQRVAPGETRSVLAGARYVCTACHVTQTSAPPLVGSTFAPAAGVP